MSQVCGLGVEFRQEQSVGSRVENWVRVLNFGFWGCGFGVSGERVWLQGLAVGLWFQKRISPGI